MRYLRIKSLLLAIMMSAVAVAVVLPRSAYAQPTVERSNYRECTEHGRSWGDDGDAQRGYFCINFGTELAPMDIDCPSGSHREFVEVTEQYNDNIDFGGVALEVSPSKKILADVNKTACVKDGYEAVEPTLTTCHEGYLPYGNQWQGYWCSKSGSFTDPDGDVAKAELTCPEGAVVEQGRPTHYELKNATKYKCVKKPPESEGGEGEGDGGAAEGEGKPECGSTVEGLGYLICPILEHAARFSDSMWGFFESLLYVNPLSNKTDDSIYKTWVMLRDLANVILAIVFIAVIISQISNAGISNYGIKKILPRLIIAAITINISYFLMQALIDIANIAGKSFDDFLQSQASMDYTKVSGWQKVVEDIVVSGALTLMTIGGAVAVTTAVSGPAALLFILLLIIPAILGLLAGIFALMFRTSVIPVLAIASPIAIAAWVLPNTQKLFDKWKEIFSGLLFLYPLSSIYYGCLKFTAIAVFLNGNSSVGERIMALVMMAVGVVGIAIFAVKSNSIMGRMVNGIMRVANKVTAPATSAIAGYAGALAGANRGRRKAEFLAQDHSKGVADARHRGILNPFRYASRAKHAIGRQMQRNEDTINLSKIQEGAFKESTDQRLRDKILADPSILGSASGTVAGKAFVRDLAYKSAETELKGKYNGNAVKALNESDNGYVKALAAKEIAERNSAGEIAQVREYLENGGSIDNTDMAEALMKMKSRDAGIAEAGKEAINRLEKSNGAPVHTDASEMRSFTQKGSRNLGDVQSAEQNAAAIQSGGMDWEQAARTLGDRHIMRTTPQENIGAIKASIEANITQQIQAGTMDKAQASRALSNSHAMENLSNQTKQQLQKIVSGAAQQAQASSGTQPASTSTASPPTSQPHAPAPPSAAHSASANVQPPTRQGLNASPPPASQHAYRASQRQVPPPPPPPANP